MSDVPDQVEALDDDTAYLFADPHPVKIPPGWFGTPEPEVESLRAERDAYKARLDKVLALCDEGWIHPDMDDLIIPVADVRAALTDTGDSDD